MEQENPAIYVPSKNGTQLRQGELLSGLREPLLLSLESGEVEILKHEFAVVLSQDCDLSTDFRERESHANQSRLLPSILLCQVAPAEEIRKNQEINSKIWSSVKKNTHMRYHFLQSATQEQDNCSKGLPELTVDFKRYFTIHTALMYQQLERGVSRRCRLNSPYLEHLSTRFSHYSSRVALPVDHVSD